MPLLNGERQVAETREGIRRDHVERYRWALPYVENLSVVDCGCGVGYGSELLAETAKYVTGIDACGEAIAYARAHYAGSTTSYVTADMATWAVPADVVVAFEVIEHLADPAPFLRQIKGRMLLCSVPNEGVRPWNPRILHHHRHYTAQQFEELLNQCGWQVDEFLGQDEDAPTPATQGRTLIARCTKAHNPQRGRWEQLPPAVPQHYYFAPVGKNGKIPETVMLCGLGPSKYELSEMMIQHDYAPPWDALWTVNKGVAFLPQADVVFVMDDIYEYAERHPAYGTELRTYAERGGVIVGQTTIPNDGSIPFHEYPLEDILQAWGRHCDRWLHTISIGYVLAYAGFIGVKRLYLAGIDCSWPNRPDLTEAGNAVVCYWIGRLEGAGCEVIINSESALNHTRQHSTYEWRKFYGYLKQPRI